MTWFLRKISNRTRQGVKYFTLVLLLFLCYELYYYKPNLQDNPPIACVDFKARLGNLMFMYAFLYCISDRKGLTYVVPEDFELIDIFEIKWRTLSSIGRDPRECKMAPPYFERWANSYDENMLLIPENRSARFKGYFQSWKYWKAYEEEMRRQFTFKPKIKSEALKQYREILQKFDFSYKNKDIVVGMHLRRGDYLTYRDIIFGKTTPDVGYYKKAMKYFKDKYNRVIFIIASNTIEWGKENFSDDKNVFFLEGNSGPVDMAIMSMANHTIMSVGSFGWFIGWMTRGTTIYYKKLYRPGSGYSEAFRNGSLTDFMYPGWIGMD